MNNLSMCLCFMVTIAAVGATISNQLCPDGVHHITCNKTIDFDGDCPPGVKIVNFNQTQKKVIVRAHNEKRNYIASGNDSRLAPACGMGKLSWKNKLARGAAFDIRQYKNGSDLCNNAAAIRNSKQNIASWGFYAIVNETRDLISAVQSFYTEVENVNQTYIDSYPENYNGPKINSFMRMMVDRSVGVGCAAGIFPIIHRKYPKYYLILCKYDISYVPGLPVYAKCNIAGEYCKNRSTKYFNLCTSK